MADIAKIKLPNGTTYNIKDSGALPLTGGTVTGPVSFQDSTSMDEATIGDLIVNGGASFTNNIQANTINGVTVGSSPKFTDTNYYHTTGSWSGLTYTATAGGGAGALAFTIPTGTAATNVAVGNHTHTITLASDSGTSAITLASATKYKLTAGGNSVIFTMPTIPTNTDTKLQVAEVTSATQYYPIVGTGTTAATRQYDTTGFKYKGTNGTTSALGSAILELGNSTGSGTANNKQAQLIMYGSNTKKATITLGAPSADVAIALPTTGGTLALTSQIPSVPSSAASATTGISVADHSSTTIYGVQSSTTTASKVTLGTAFSVPNVTAAGSGSFTSGAFSGGSGSFSATVTDHVLSFSHTHNAATHGADTHTHVAPSFGTAFSIPNVTGATNVTVPIKNTSTTTVITSKTHTVTDNGHTHTLS